MVEPPMQRIPIPNVEFHQLVKDVCAGKAIDERYGQIEDWDVSGVSDMSHAFENRTDFNRDISRWNTSNVVTMKSMFHTTTPFNQPLNEWNVSNVTTIDGMFQMAASFNLPLNDWNVSKVTTMGYTFFIIKSTIE